MRIIKDKMLNKSPCILYQNYHYFFPVGNNNHVQAKKGYSNVILFFTSNKIKEYTKTIKRIYYIYIYLYIVESRKDIFFFFLQFII